VYRVHRYQIESSTNGTDWALLADASGEDRQGWDDWAVADVSARYLRFTGLSNSANQCVVLSELEVYGDRCRCRHWCFRRRPSTCAKAAGPVLRAAAERADGQRGDEREPVFGRRLDHDRPGAVRGFKPSNWSVWQAVVLAGRGRRQRDRRDGHLPDLGPGLCGCVRGGDGAGRRHRREPGAGLGRGDDLGLRANLARNC
jgi:hypothetical protein